MLSGMEIVHVSRLLAQRETLKTEGKMELVSGLTYHVLEQSLPETESPIGNVIGPTTHRWTTDFFHHHSEQVDKRTDL